MPHRKTPKTPPGNRNGLRTGRSGVKSGQSICELPGVAHLRCIAAVEIDEVLFKSRGFGPPPHHEMSDGWIHTVMCTPSALSDPPLNGECVAPPSLVP